MYCKYARANNLSSLRRHCSGSYAVVLRERFRFVLGKLLGVLTRVFELAIIEDRVGRHALARQTLKENFFSEPGVEGVRVYRQNWFHEIPKILRFGVPSARDVFVSPTVGGGEGGVFNYDSDAARTRGGTV